MNLPHRIRQLARVFLLALVLPALLAPSGWAWRLCFCDAMVLGGLVHRSADSAAEELDSCCRPAPVERSCCEGESDGESGMPEGCNECRVFDAGNAGLAVVTTPDLPVTAPPAPVGWVLVFEEPPSGAPRALEVACRAPPGASRNLPLRI